MWCSITLQKVLFKIGRKSFSKKKIYLNNVRKEILEIYCIYFILFHKNPPRTRRPSSEPKSVCSFFQFKKKNKHPEVQLHGELKVRFLLAAAHS